MNKHMLVMPYYNSERKIQYCYIGKNYTREQVETVMFHMAIRRSHPSQMFITDKTIRRFLKQLQEEGVKLYSQPSDENKDFRIATSNSLPTHSRFSYFGTQNFSSEQIQKAIEIANSRYPDGSSVLLSDSMVIELLGLKNSRYKSSQFSAAEIGSTLENKSRAGMFTRFRAFLDRLTGRCRTEVNANKRGYDR